MTSARRMIASRNQSSSPEDPQLHSAHVLIVMSRARRPRGKSVFGGM